MEPKVGQIWRHYKGGVYRIIALAKNSETDDIYDTIGYEDMTAPKTWTQSHSRFTEPIEWEGEKISRFTFVSEARHKHPLIEFFGWYGAVAVLIAYCSVSFGYFSAGGFWFQFLNATGSAGLALVAYIKKDWQLAILNLIWAIIALIVLIK
jgi:hypothetical protein